MIKEGLESKPGGKIDLVSLLPNPQHKYEVMSQIGEVIGLSSVELSTVIKVLAVVERGYLVFSVDGAEIELEGSPVRGVVGVNIRLKFSRNLDPSKISKEC